MQQGLEAYFQEIKSKCQQSKLIDFLYITSANMKEKLVGGDYHVMNVDHKADYTNNIEQCRERLSRIDARFLRKNILKCVK